MKIIVAAKKLIKIVRIFFLFLIIHYTTTFSLLAQSIEESKDLAKMKNLFEEAKEEFEIFESEHGHFVQTPNARMHYLTWGNPSGIPLIWSHGSFSNGYELLDVADNLVKAGYFVIAIDYYGHGQTALPVREVSLYHVADDIKYLMDHLNINRAVIGGWSRGGFISTAFYDTYPKHTLGLILEDGGSVATNTNYHKLEQDSLEKLIYSFEVEKYIEADT